jgi:signal transduction histidine kinase
LKSTIPFAKSIRFKATVILFIVFLSVIVPINWIIFQKIKNTLEEVDSNELKTEAEKSLGSVKFNPTTISLPPSGYLLKLQASKDLLYETIFSSPGFPSLSTADYFSEFIYFDSLKISHVKKPIDDSGGVLIVSLARSNSKSTRQIAEIRSYLMLANLLSILLGGVLLFFISGRLIRPIQKIIFTASQITASNRIARVPTPATQDESKLLADTLNEMLGRIERSIKNQVNFFASAAHELKTPLAVMQTEIGISLDHADSATKVILENQLTEVQRLTRIIHDFLLVSQLKSETLIIRKKEEQIEEVIYAALKKLKYILKDNGTKLQITIAENTALAQCNLDFDKGETVVINLIENAIRYSPPNTLIDISAKVELNSTTVTVRNSISLPIKNFNFLKNEFEKSDPLSRGLGMGLWICDQIMKLHQGKLELETSPTEFVAIIRFPQGL